MNLITRREVAELTGYSINYLNSSAGVKLFPIRERTATGRVFYDREEVLRILEDIKAKRQAGSWVKDPLFS